MKVRYIGPSKGAFSLTDGKIYECLGVEDGFFRIIDDEGYSYWDKEENEMEGYLYAPVGTIVLEDGSRVGRFEVMQDDENHTLQKAIDHFR